MKVSELFESAKVKLALERLSIEEKRDLFRAGFYLMDEYPEMQFDFIAAHLTPTEKEYEAGESTRNIRSLDVNELMRGLMGKSLQRILGLDKIDGPTEDVIKVLLGFVKEEETEAAKITLKVARLAGHKSPELDTIEKSLK